ncbi:hypothetical protein K438DRAFT_1779830 [Mycena galopus ATCC 62051]|nr:hypothetical protein K438DRAFT_1779830 [Mycena galopus ATCC 62051]
MAQRRQNIRMATLSSSRLTVTRTHMTASGRPKAKTVTLTPAGKGQARGSYSTPTRALRDVPDPYDDNDMLDAAYEDTADISHVGEDINEDTADASQTLLEQLRAHHKYGSLKNLFTFLLFPRAHDHRKRTNRTQIRVNAFAAQMEAMVDQYMQWSLAMAEDGFGRLYEQAGPEQPEDAVVQDTHRIYVVDLFSASYVEVGIVQGDRNLAAAYICHGLVPTTPQLTTVAITIRSLEVFRVTQLWCPCLGLQPFVRALCDLHSIPPRSYLTVQFSIAFDVYLAIHAEVEKGFGATSGSRREVMCSDGTSSPRGTKEQLDDRFAPGDYYLPRAEVDQWAKEGLDEMLKDFSPGSVEEDEGSGCAEYKGECHCTGFFPCLCRHSFVLVVVDMVKSGELAKYGFAITAHLLRILGEVGTGYDIGCKFGKMVQMRRQQLQVSGWRIPRPCSQSQMPTQESLHDLEECESFFSKSNALAATTHYATTFHRQQAITSYLKHADSTDTYQGLALLLAAKYRRALGIKDTLPLLRETMASLGVESRSVFEMWLEKEKVYLESLTKEPVQETLQMEYYQKLVNLADHEKWLDELRSLGLPFIMSDGTSSYSMAAADTRRIETQRHHMLEVFSKTLVTVQDLEVRLGITRRWEPDDEEWVAAARMVINRRYQRALDELEGLVVARMFELSKAHMSDTASQKGQFPVKKTANNDYLSPGLSVP